jgi:excinuclease ABC subunit A
VGLLVCVTGVSGSGKSTLVNDTLYAAVARHLYGAQAEPAPHAGVTGMEHFDKVVSVDQSPIGRTPRSNPATYTGLLAPIRDLYAGLPEARARGYDAGRFSFNVRGGRCEACQGDGVTRVEMHFLPDLYVACDACHGRRYNRETLEVKYKGRSIHEVLQLTVAEALEFFAAVPAIRRKLETLSEVGLAYIQLGQSATTLSGGEAQRVKLSLELSKRDTGRTLYILDEPTTGLHFHDIQLLLNVLHRLRDAGNTVVVIEHNLDVIKTADWVIDLGPEGGEGGGRVVAAGTPEQIAACADSHTGQILKRVLTEPRKKESTDEPLTDRHLGRPDRSVRRRQEPTRP